MDPIDRLIGEAIYHEVQLNKNQFITQETIVQRLFRKITEKTRVVPCHLEKTLLFGKWHDEILDAYLDLRATLSHDEKISVERVLSKDTPNATELTKFACCWYKYRPATACKWFAVDGLLGTHPKHYVQDAFSPQFARHNDAVRALYAYLSDPEKIRGIVEKAFLLNEGEPCPPDLDTESEMYISMYAETAGEEEMKSVVAERKAKMQQPQPCKRKKVSAPPNQCASAPSK